MAYEDSLPAAYRPSRRRSGNARGERHASVPGAGKCWARGPVQAPGRLALQPGQARTEGSAETFGSRHEEAGGADHNRRLTTRWLPTGRLGRVFRRAACTDTGSADELSVKSNAHDQACCGFAAGIGTDIYRWREYKRFPADCQSFLAFARFAMGTQRAHQPLGSCTISVACTSQVRLPSIRRD